MKLVKKENSLTRKSFVFLSKTVDPNNQENILETLFVDSEKCDDVCTNNKLNAAFCNVFTPSSDKLEVCLAGVVDMTALKILHPIFGDCFIIFDSEFLTVKAL
jgi:hypothetical protein